MKKYFRSNASSQCSLFSQWLEERVTFDYIKSKQLEMLHADFTNNTIRSYFNNFQYLT
jgi:hypothetical protein